MKRKILAALAVFIVVMSLLLVSCNKQVFDVTYAYDRAILSLPNGEVIDGKVTSWKDFDDGDQIQVTYSVDLYLVHSSNIVLIDD